MGLLKESEDLFSWLDLQRDSDVTERPQRNNRELSDYEAFPDIGRPRSHRYVHACSNMCSLCGTFPRPLLDLNTGNSRPVPLTQLRVTTEHGQLVYLLTGMARFSFNTVNEKRRIIWAVKILSL